MINNETNKFRFKIIIVLRSLELIKNVNLYFIYINNEFIISYNRNFK